MVLRFFTIVALVSLWASTSGAQNAQTIINMFGAMISASARQQVEADWKAIDSTERNCVERTLRNSGSSISQQIENGIGPSDPRLRDERQSCRTGRDHDHARPATTKYQVEGLSVGGTVNVNSSIYQQYDCGSSPLSPTLVRCVRTFKDKEKRGHYTATLSILHDKDGTVSYVNRYQDPAYFDDGEIDQAIGLLSNKHGTPHIQIVENQGVVKRSKIATWGGLKLRRLIGLEVQQTARGGEYREGIRADLLGNFQRSAQLELPIWRIEGDAGFAYIATELTNGKNVLRFFAADASKFNIRQTPETPMAGNLQTVSILPASISPNEQPDTQKDQGRRVALIIGNSRYQHTGLLRNPANDARLLAQTLKSTGFDDVTIKLDLTREQIIEALKQFRTTADDSSWAVVYFSGHGIESDGVNYLVPVDARLREERDLSLEAVSAGSIEASMQGATRLRLLILDACRDNPFAAEMQRKNPTRSARRGLAKSEPDTGSLIVYAAKHGETALDGDGQNSPFMEALARRIKQKPSIELRRLFDHVRDDVLASTKRRQQPFSYSSLSASDDFYFQ